ncbi:MAG: J domain-containing protein [Desulfobacteraceae bacterium]|nr:J domain-containing protein [Desulfobacteraceae bacterium]
MKLQRCFQILELDSTASIDEVRQAYKDIVNVWHPDRFSHNARLKQKAEAKLKQVNVAYEEVTSFLSPEKEMEPAQKESSRAKTEAREDAELRGKTEIAVEAGTHIILTLCSYLYGNLRRLVVDQTARAEKEAKAEAETDRPDH